MLAEPSFDVIARAQRGDHDAFRAIVVAYQHKVHTMLARMLAGTLSLAEVEELAQDTFLRVYRALPRFRARHAGGLTRWILTVTARIGIDSLRRRRLMVVPLDDDHGAIAALPRRLDPETRLFLASALAAAIARLPAPQRMVFVLCDYYDVDQREIARLLSIRPGTVKSRLSRARAALRAQLAEEEP